MKLKPRSGKRSKKHRRFSDRLKINASGNYEINFVKDINDFEIFGFENEFIQALINILQEENETVKYFEHKC